jgi:hypothetical protein
VRNVGAMMRFSVSSERSRTVGMLAERYISRFPV